jgi:hypothetical protein
MLLRRRREAKGLDLPGLRRSLWLLAGEPGELAALHGLATAALHDRPGILPVFSAPRGPERAGLASRFPHELVTPLPAPGAAGRAIATLRPVAAVVCGTDAAWRAAWRTAFRARGIPVLAAGRAADLSAEGLRATLPLLDDSRQLRESLRHASRPRRGLGYRLARQASKRLAGRRLADLAAIAARLGPGRPIVCLGNGPSALALDPTLRPGALLFRVNWRWRDQSPWNDPDLVFVGDPATVTLVRAPVFAFQRRDNLIEATRRHLARLAWPDFDHILLDGLALPGAPETLPARPTNGALMIALAVALAPPWLAIGGIDLFAHPAGRYAGDPHAAGGYYRAHEAAVELEFLRRVLAGYRGELRLAPSPLAAALEA